MSYANCMYQANGMLQCQLPPSSVETFMNTSCYGVPGKTNCYDCESVVQAYKENNWKYNTNDFEQCTCPMNEKCAVQAVKEFLAVKDFESIGKSMANFLMRVPNDLLSNLRGKVVEKLTETDKLVIVNKLNTIVNKYIVPFYNQDCIKKSTKPSGNVWAIFLYAKANGCIINYK